MPKGKKHGVDEVIVKLREAEVVMSQGQSQELAAKAIGVSAQTLIRWRKEYGGLRMDQAKRLKELEKENARLKRLLADAELGRPLRGRPRRALRRREDQPSWRRIPFRRASAERGRTPHRARASRSKSRVDLRRLAASISRREPTYVGRSPRARRRRCGLLRDRPLAASARVCSTTARALVRRTCSASTGRRR